MPECMIVEWNEYLDWEISQWTQAIMSAIPTAKTIESNGKPIKDPTTIEALFDKLGAKTTHG